MQVTTYNHAWLYRAYLHRHNYVYLAIINNGLGFIQLGRRAKKIETVGFCFIPDVQVVSNDLIYLHSLVSLRMTPFFQHPSIIISD